MIGQGSSKVESAHCVAVAAMKVVGDLISLNPTPVEGYHWSWGGLEGVG